MSPLRQIATVEHDATHRTRVLAGRNEVLLVHEELRPRLGAYVLVALEPVSPWQPAPGGELGAAILDARQTGARP